MRQHNLAGEISLQFFHATFIKAFVRESIGVWRCVQPATLDLASGRIQVNPGNRFTRGMRFMNVDVAAQLDEHYAKSHPAG